MRSWKKSYRKKIKKKKSLIINDIYVEWYDWKKKTSSLKKERENKENQANLLNLGKGLKHVTH